MPISYMMEGENEVRRLAVKDNAENTYKQLLETGISQKMEAGCTIVDAGSGVGIVAEQIAIIAKNSSRTPDIILLDASDDRLTAARNRLANYELNQKFLNCDLEHLPLPDKSVDYLVCRFVFEYLQRPENVFAEFIRVMKPGGKLVVGDLDNNSLSHYPLSDTMQYKLDMISRELSANLHFDFHAGRKIYSYFFDYNCRNIVVHFYAHHLFYGDLGGHDDFNWMTKLERLIDLQNKGVINLNFSVKDFSREFMEFLRSPRRFSYTPLILVEGVVCHE